MVAVFVILGVVLLILAGLNLGTPRFAPEWFGLACLAIAVFWASLSRLT